MNPSKTVINFSVLGIVNNNIEGNQKSTRDLRE